MQSLRRQDGFTLLELMIVVAIMGAIVAFAIPSLWRYQVKEDARSNAQAIAGVIRGARDQAIRQGTQQFVLFDAPASGAGAILRVTRDVDGNWQETAVDQARDLFPQPSTSASVSAYGQGAINVYAAAPLAPSDPAAGNLGTIADGASFPQDPNTLSLGFGFTARGVPVALATPTTWGSGAGAFYVTDNVRNVFAVELGPLGEIRVRSFDPATNSWQ